jgi:hypothetical protein
MAQLTKIKLKAVRSIKQPRINTTTLYSFLILSK